MQSDFYHIKKSNVTTEEIASASAMIIEIIEKLQHIIGEFLFNYE